MPVPAAAATLQSMANAQLAKFILWFMLFEVCLDVLFTVFDFSHFEYEFGSNRDRPVVPHRTAPRRTAALLQTNKIPRFADTTHFVLILVILLLLLQLLLLFLFLFLFLVLVGSRLGYT